LLALGEHCEKQKQDACASQKLRKTDRLRIHTTKSIQPGLGTPPVRSAWDPATFGGGVARLHSSNSRHHSSAVNPFGRPWREPKCLVKDGGSSRKRHLSCQVRKAICRSAVEGKRTARKGCHRQLQPA
jgi:hypothetical protein